MTTPALLVMDLQRGVADRYSDEAYLTRLATAIAAARAAAVPVLYVTVAFREGHPEVSDRNARFAAIAASGEYTEGRPATQVHPAVAPAPGEPVIVKRRVSAFAGSDLDLVLRSRGIDHLVLTGIATSGVVLSTLRQAADLDYQITVLADGCLDADPEVHEVLTGKIFPRQAEVTTIADWTSSLP
jgi:nicotinamidase-related amidase